MKQGLVDASEKLDCPSFLCGAGAAGCDGGVVEAGLLETPSVDAGEVLVTTLGMPDAGSFIGMCDSSTGHVVQPV
ncbi:MAG: hypothetical protein HY901_27265 [Deltaproteobacteria bacterium]|nr:hypothetical protein [Deltaproteobacteria bacterium]